MIRPDGQPGIYGVVHYKNKAIGVLPVDDDGQIWLVGQYRYPLDAYSWEIPEGGGPEGEVARGRPRRRELREETGLDRRPGRTRRSVAPLELGQRRGCLSLSGDRVDPGRERARRDRAAPGPPVRLADRLGDGPARADHRLDERHRPRGLIRRNRRWSAVRRHPSLPCGIAIEWKGAVSTGRAMCFDPKMASEGKFLPGQAVGPSANWS